MSRADSPLHGRMIFVVGARRSGTNWLQQLLTLHPQVAAVPSETYLFWDAVPALQARVQHGLFSSTKTGLTYMPREDFLDGVRDFCDRLFVNLREAGGAGASYLVERTPWHARRVDVINAVYPDAAVLHIIRDPREVSASLVAQEWGPAGYAEAAQEWVDCIREARAAGHPRYREIRQEDLSNDPVGEMKGLFAHVGVPVDDEMLEEVRRRAGVPVNVDRRNSAVGREKWRASMSPEDIRTVEAVAGGLMTDLGYAPAAAVPSRSAPATDLQARARTSLRRVRTAVQRRATPPAGDAAAPMSPLWLERAQWTVDELMSAVACDDEAAARALLTDDAVVTVPESGGTGVDAWWAAMPRHLGLKQRVADVHGGYPSYTVVTEHDDEGRRHLEVFVITPHGAKVGALAYYLRTTPSA